MDGPRHGRWDRTRPTAASNIVLALTRDRLRRELLAVEHLPAAPEIVAKVVELTATNAETSTRDLADVVGHDPALAARLLGLANSSIVGAARPVTTITQAIVLLGFAQVRDLAFSVSVWDRFADASGVTAIRRRSLWLHSVTVAAVARRFAAKAGLDTGTAFAAGLLHDIGKLVLALRRGAPYWAMLDRAIEEKHRIEDLERQTFGCDHGVVGGWLLSSWKIPEPLVEAAAEHHGSEARHGVVHAVALADAVVVTMEAAFGNDGDRGPSPGPAGHRPSGVDVDELVDVYAAAMRERESLIGVLDGDVGDVGSGRLR